MVDVLGSKNHYVSKTNQQYPYFGRHVVVLCGNGPITVCNEECVVLEINELEVTRVMRDGA